MKILHCIPNMAGGGAERQLVYLSKELVRRGWEVHVALLKEGPNWESLCASGSTIHKIPARGNYDIAILGRLIKLIRAIRPHLVQTWMTQMDVFGGWASIWTRTPFVLSERSAAAAYTSGLKQSLRIMAGRQAAAIIANSSEGSRYWQVRTGNSILKGLVCNSLPLAEIEKVKPSTDGFNLPFGEKLILFAGRFSPEKNIETIVRAFKEILSFQKAFLLLCGDGELRPKIQSLVREEGLSERVFLPGYVQDIWGLMKGADLFIGLSTFEGHPNAVLEAMACGCPLILSDIPAHRAFLDEKNAFFVDPGNIENISRAILTCLDKPEAAKQKTEKAMAAAQSFSIETITDQYETIYKQILTNQGIRKS